MLVVDCKGVGLGILINPENGDVGIFLSLHEEEEGPAVAQIILPLERGAQISASFMARLLEAKGVEDEIQGYAPDDREEAVRRIMERMSSGLN